MYLSKELLLAAYADLATLTADPTQQGTTQKVSAIRYFIAMDAFCKQTTRAICDTNVSEDRLKFCACVSDIVEISSSLYTPAFYWPLKEHSGDCGTGSNFFSAGQVNNSKTAPGQDFPYPKRGGWPSLLIAKSGKIRIFSKGRSDGYHNIDWYIGDKRHYAAMFIWMAREWGSFSGTNELSEELKNEALNHYSNELIEATFPSENVFADFLVNIHEKYASEQPQITPEDIKSLFPHFLPMQSIQQGRVSFDSYQLITYGAPGTGKSHGIEDVVGNYEDTIRTTFHPDSDYSSFVGAYKPTMSASRQIEYVFRPQAFTNAYVQAWTKMAEADAQESVQPQFLVIEEINRGNCAQIFGDLFQLLDRDCAGYSKYPIDADIDLASHMATEFGKLPADAQERVPPEVRSGKKLKLPPNLYIWATMNTSDQSLFPIDSAFKRRWDWKYIPIAKPDEPDWKDRKVVANGKEYDWWTFISIVNAHIAAVTKSEDKQMGYFFVKAPDDTGHIMAESFANKVLFYLFNDVFKDWDLPMAIFGKGAQSKEKYAFKDFFYAKKVTEGGKDYHPGDVKEEVVAEFIERQELDGTKMVGMPLANPIPLAAQVPAPAQPQ